MPSDEIRLYATDMLRSCIEYETKTRMALTEATDYSFDQHPRCVPKRLALQVIKFVSWHSI